MRTMPSAMPSMTSLVTEIAKDKSQTKRTITLIRIVDMARLVRLAPLKRLGLDRVRSLFETTATPAESRKWIDALAAETPTVPPYRAILNAIHEVQKGDPTEAVQFPALRNQLRLNHSIALTPQELFELCAAMGRFVPQLVTIQGKRSIEIDQRPDKVLKALGAAMRAQEQAQ